MLAGGSEAAVIPSGIGGFIACKALSKRNAQPAAASRPWDKGRDGFVMGEGAGAGGALPAHDCVAADARRCAACPPDAGGVIRASSVTSARGCVVSHAMQNCHAVASPGGTPKSGETQAGCGPSRCRCVGRAGARTEERRPHSRGIPRGRLHLRRLPPHRS